MFGVLPLALSSGAGSGSRRAIGVGVLGGVATATALGIFFVPLFFVVIRRFFAPETKPEAAPTLPLLATEGTP
jgi:Cu/Ag efflux pump CusA